MSGLTRSICRPICRPLWRPISGAASIWTPAALFSAGQAGIWYEPKPEYLYQDSAGTTPVTADGQPVGYMKDLSGNGNRAIQSTAALKPTYRTDGTLHWLEGDGVDDFMGTTALPSALLSPETGMMAVSAESASASKIGGLISEQAVGAELKRVILYGDTRASPSRHSNFSPTGLDSYLNLASQWDTSPRVITASARSGVYYAYVDSIEVDSSVISASFSGDTIIEILRQLAGPVHFEGKMFGCVAVGGSADNTTGAINDYLATLSGVTL